MKGCIAGSAFFCVAIAKTLKWLRGQAAFVVAIADDITFCAPTEKIHVLFTELLLRFLEPELFLVPEPNLDPALETRAGIRYLIPDTG